MVKLNQMIIGALLIGISIVLIILLALVKVDIDKRDTLLCQAFRLSPEQDMEQCPAHKSNTSWFIIISFGIAFFVLGGGLYLIFMPSKREALKRQERLGPKISKADFREPKIENKGIGNEITTQFKEIDTSKFDEDEEKIYGLLKQHEGSMYQSDLIKETGLSKVKITRILDKMTLKNVLDRKRRGMTNIIFLK